VTNLNGQVNDVWIASTAMYSFLVVVVNIRISLDTCTWNWISFLFMFLSIFAWFMFAIIYSAIISITPNMFYVGQRVFGDINFWLLMFLAPAVCNLPDVARRYWRRMYYPDLLDIIAERDRIESQSYQPQETQSGVSSKDDVELDKVERKESNS